MIENIRNPWLRRTTLVLAFVPCVALAFAIRQFALVTELARDARDGWVDTWRGCS